MSSYKNTFKSVVPGYFLLGVSIIRNILLIPYLLEYWGSENYGTWIILLATSGLLQIFHLAYHSYAGPYLINCVGINFKQHLNNILTLNLWLSVLILVIYGLVTFFTKIINPWSYLLFISWALFGSFTGLLAKSLAANGFYHIALKGQILQISIELTLILLSTYFFSSIYITLISLATSYLIYFLVINKLHHNRIGHYKIIKLKKSIVIEHKKGIFSYLLLSGYEQIKINGIPILVERFFGLDFIVKYTTTRTLINLFNSLINVVLTPYQYDAVNLFKTNINSIEYLVNE